MTAAPCALTPVYEHIIPIPARLFQSKTLKRNPTSWCHLHNTKQNQSTPKPSLNSHIILRLFKNLINKPASIILRNFWKPFRCSMKKNKPLIFPFNLLPSALLKQSVLIHKQFHRMAVSARNVTWRLRILILLRRTPFASCLCYTSDTCYNRKERRKLRYWSHKPLLRISHCVITSRNTDK